MKDKGGDFGFWKRNFERKKQAKKNIRKLVCSKNQHQSGDNKTEHQY